MILCEAKSVERRFVSVIIRAIHGRCLRLSDGLQAELHHMVRSCLKKLDFHELTRVTDQSLRQGGIRFAIRLRHHAARHRTGTTTRRRVIRPSTLHRAFPVDAEVGPVDQMREDFMAIHTLPPEAVGRKSSGIFFLEEDIDSSDAYERSYFLDREFIGSAVFARAGEQVKVTFAWPLSVSTDVEKLLQVYLQEVASGAVGDQGLVIESWAGDLHSQFSTMGSAKADEIVKRASAPEGGSRLPLNLLQVISKSCAFEVLYSREASRPIRAALVMSSVPAASVMSMFSAYHRDASIRTRYMQVQVGTAALKMKSDAREMFEPLEVQ